MRATYVYVYRTYTVPDTYIHTYAHTVRTCVMSGSRFTQKRHQRQLLTFPPFSRVSSRVLLLSLPRFLTLVVGFNRRCTRLFMFVTLSQRRAKDNSRIKFRGTKCLRSLGLETNVRRNSCQNLSALCTDTDRYSKLSKYRATRRLERVTFDTTRTS